MSQKLLVLVRKSGLVFLFVLLVFFCQQVKSQSDTISDFSISTKLDVFSRYWWRGLDLEQSPSIQPTLSLGWKGFTIGAWGAYKLTGAGVQETDLFISQSIGPVEIAVWDYWTFNDTLTHNYFDYNKNTTSHLFDTQVTLSGNEKIPFNLIGSYLFYGTDTTGSVYCELQYFHEFKEFELLVFSGIQARGTFYADKAGFVNVGCTVKRDLLKIGEFAIPLSISLVFNPVRKDALIIAGISF